MAIAYLISLRTVIADEVCWTCNCSDAVVKVDDLQSLMCLCLLCRTCCDMSDGKSS